MGVWPFRRKSNGSQSRGGAEISRSEKETMRDAGTSRDRGRHNGPEVISTGPERRRSRRDSQRKRKASKDSKKLRDPEKPRTYSFSPGRNDSIMVQPDSHRPPVPPVPAKHKGKGRADTEKAEPSSVGNKPLRASTQPPETTAQEWQRVPTLHKRSAQDLARRKSSKKRKEEHDREAEIKAMVSFMPTRPATESGIAGRPMKRESKRMHGGLNRNLQNPSSDISLPFAESILSSLSSKSEYQTSYKLSAFDMLAPRPTIQYFEREPQYGPLNRSDSKKRRLSERVTIPEEILKANKRIDDLADDLDASELRELMERDQKRREKKKIAEKIEMERKLARRQEKQMADETTAIRGNTPPPPNMERGVLGRDVIGLGIGTSAVVTSSKRRDSAASESGGEKRPAEVFREDSMAGGDNPFSDTLDEQLTPGSENSEPVIEVARVGTVGKANVSPPLAPRGHTRGASSISQMMELAGTAQVKTPSPAPAKAEPVKQTPTESSSRTPPQSWTSFFKRSKTKRASTPSSFSNTSRDSMQGGQGPTIGYTPMRSTSNIPKRTMSKFREDLPELPLSPPDSRVQSPEADDVPPIRTDYPDKKSGSRTSNEDPPVRYDTPTSGYRSLDITRLRNETPTSGHRSVDAPSPEPTTVMSQSLASIGSEGSWLSGRKGGSKRGSAQTATHPLRDSASSLQKRYKEYSESVEELGIAEDEYFSRLTPGPDDQHRIRRQSAANASSDEEDGGSMGSPVPSEKTKWGAVGRQPTVVHREPRAKSREGLLNEYDVDSGSEPPGETPDEIPGNRRSYGLNKDLIQKDEPSLHRASSVDLGRGHVRHISAGSARLLELKSRRMGRD